MSVVCSLKKKTFSHSHLNSKYHLVVLILHFLESLLFSYYWDKSQDPSGYFLTIIVSFNKKTVAFNCLSIIFMRKQIHRILSLIDNQISKSSAGKKLNYKAFYKQPVSAGLPLGSEKGYLLDLEWLLDFGLVI